jgi:Resolvase, N terminal domain
MTTPVVAGYTRVSTERQAEAQAIAQQLERLRAYTARRGAQLQAMLDRATAPPPAGRPPTLLERSSRSPRGAVRLRRAR